VSGRTVLRLDAAFEALLAALCLTWALRLFGTDTWTLPPWLAGPVLFGVAAVLVGAAVGLWLLADRTGPAALRVVAIANALTALAALTWAITCDGGPLRIVLSTVAVALAVLAPTQLHLSRRPLQP
jgi:hypothetical protein